MIPKPRSPSHYRLEALQSIMTNISAERFKALTIAVYDAADWHLQVDKHIDKQDRANWERFRVEVVGSFPELDHYQDFWPLQTLLSGWKQKIRNLHRRFRSNDLQEHDSNLPNEVSNRHTFRENRSTSVGQPLPRRMSLIKSGHTDAFTRCTSLDITKERQAEMPIYESNLPGGARDSSLDWQSGITLGHSNPAVMTTVRKSLENLVACLSCDHLPNVPNSRKVKIETALQSDACVSVLRGLGICNDEQLHLLMNLRAWGLGPEEFLDSIPGAELSPLYRVHLLRKLKPQLGLIPWPSPDVEARLVNEISVRSPLLRICGLAHKLQYPQIIQAVNEASKNASSMILQDLERRVSARFPFLKDYENNWPLMLHFKWRSQREHAIEGSGIYTPIVNNAIQDAPNCIPSRQSYQVPSSGCPIHPPNGEHAPQKLQVLLGTFGMEELTPLFLMVHVRSDDDYDLMRGLDEQERLRVFDEQLNILHVRRFQRWMLRFILQIIDIF